MNRSPELFHDPSSFAPERWLDPPPDSPYYNDKRKSIQPFSVGPRVCMSSETAFKTFANLILLHLGMYRPKSSLGRVAINLGGLTLRV
jgi:cytochrome P450